MVAHSLRKEATMPAGSEIPHQAPKVRGEQLVDRIEDAAVLLTLFSGVAIAVAILLLFVVL
jgi:hypothetical protein